MRLRSAAILPLLATAMLPAAVSAQPVASGYDAAVAARLSGQPKRAVELLGIVLAREPGNADARLQLGLALLALRRLDAAEAAFRAVLTADPGYVDARLGLSRVAQERGDLGGAETALAGLDAANPEVVAQRERLRAAAGPRWRLDVDGAFSDVGGGRSDWYDGAVGVRYHADPLTTYHAGVEAGRRFGSTDVYGEIGVERRVSDRTILSFAAGGTPGADFRPKWQLRAGASIRATDGGNATVFTLGGHYASYISGDVQALSPGIEQYFADGRLWLTARSINYLDEDGDYRAGYLLRGDALASERLRLFAGYSDAPDSSEGLVVDTRSIFGGVSFDATDRATVRASLTHESRSPGVEQWRFGFGMGWAF